jgi:hypothetical protein
MLPRNERQEGLSRAYVRAVAAHAGLMYTEPAQDYGIDVCLRTVAVRGRRHGPGAVQLDVQLKSTTRANVGEHDLTYDLEVKNYNDLRAPAPMCPRILIVLVLPADESLWLSQSPEELTVRHCAYWYWLGGAGPTATTRTVRITIPKDNVFSVSALNAIVSRLERGEQPCGMNSGAGSIPV